MEPRRRSLWDRFTDIRALRPIRTWLWVRRYMRAHSDLVFALARADDYEPVRISLALADGGFDRSEVMPRKVARSIVTMIPLAHWRWDASTRTFGTGLAGGHHIMVALIEDAF